MAEVGGGVAGCLKTSAVEEVKVEGTWFMGGW